MLRLTVPRNLLWLALVAFAGFFLFGVLHNVFYGMAKLAAEMPVLPRILEVLSVAAFLAAVLLCPALLVLGLGGALFLWLRSFAHRP